MELLEERRLLAAAYYQLSLGGCDNLNYTGMLHVGSSSVTSSDGVTSDLYLALNGSAADLVSRAVSGTVNGWYASLATYSDVFSNADPFSIVSTYDSSGDTYTGEIQFRPPNNLPNCTYTACSPSGPGNWSFSLAPLTASIGTVDPSGVAGDGSTAIEADQDGHPVNGHFYVQLSGQAEGAVTLGLNVDTTVDSAATPGHEYNTLPSTITINAGDTVADVAVQPRAINHVQETKVVHAVLQDGGADVTQSTAEVGIMNTDDSTITLDSRIVTVGSTISVAAHVLNHYGLPKATTLAISGLDSSLLSSGSSSVSSGDDGVALIPLSGVAAGTSAIVLVDPAGNRLDANQPVGNPTLHWTDDSADEAIVYVGQKIPMNVYVGDAEGIALEGAGVGFSSQNNSDALGAAFVFVQGGVVTDYEGYGMDKPAIAVKSTQGHPPVIVVASYQGVSISEECHCHPGSGHH